MCTHWSDGGDGATELAQNVIDICEENKKLDKLSRMRELENWLDYLNLE